MLSSNTVPMIPQTAVRLECLPESRASYIAKNITHDLD